METSTPSCRPLRSRLSPSTRTRTQLTFETIEAALMQVARSLGSRSEVARGNDEALNALHRMLGGYLGLTTDGHRTRWINSSESGVGQSRPSLEATGQTNGSRAASPTRFR
jgi:hypothetical protein